MNTIDKSTIKSVVNRD